MVAQGLAVTHSFQIPSTDDLGEMQVHAGVWSQSIQGYRAESFTAVNKPQNMMALVEMSLPRGF